MPMKRIRFRFFLVVNLFLTVFLFSSQAPSPGYVDQGAKLTAEKYRFTPDNLTFEAGKPITVILTSIDGDHSFDVDALNVHSSEAGKGKSVVVEFTADQPGRYEFYCGHGNHKQRGMTGTLEIKAKQDQ